MTNNPRRNFIGKQVHVTEADNTTLKDKRGIVDDETKHTLIIEGKRIIKNQITIAVDNKTIKGTTIDNTPTERIKVHKK